MERSKVEYSEYSGSESPFSQNALHWTDFEDIDPGDFSGLDDYDLEAILDSIKEEDLYNYDLGGAEGDKEVDKELEDGEMSEMEFDFEYYSDYSARGGEASRESQFTPIVNGRPCPEVLSKYRRPAEHTKRSRQDSSWRSSARIERLSKPNNQTRKRESEIFGDLAKILMSLDKENPSFNLFDSKLKSRQPSRIAIMQACRRLFHSHLINVSSTRNKAESMRNRLLKEYSQLSPHYVDLRRAIGLKISQCENIIKETGRAINP